MMLGSRVLSGFRILKKYRRICFLLLPFVVLTVFYWGWLAPEIECPKGSTLKVDRNLYFVKESEYCVNNLGERHGPALGWHGIGSKESLANYEHGYVTGQSIDWYKNGQTELIENRKENSSIYKKWHENGQLKYEAEFDKHGKCLWQKPHSKYPEFPCTKCWDENGKVSDCPELY